ncbi:hypothetical protein [Bacteroides sp. 51]|uniref:hypothetical protein n=1 Tax=Bacteroides sp. 51 TaxID=2302938 RepID=UPI0013D6B202|nr:hypothetical protein [Bacteroides sp. 51]NDV83359.1 hypothetical protein [Bacteroides sp. 51]
MNKKLTEAQSHQLPRQFLSHLFLSDMEKSEYTVNAYAKNTGVSVRSLYYLQKGKLLSMAKLCQLFSSQPTLHILTSENLCWLMNRIICESLREATRYPVLRVIPMDKKHITLEHDTLSEFMKSMRVDHLQISTRETYKRFEYCTTAQLSSIERGCYGIGIGPICNLFDNYHRSLPKLPDQAWGTFATLLLHYMFPLLKDYAVEFVGWKNEM